MDKFNVLEFVKTQCVKVNSPLRYLPDESRFCWDDATSVSLPTQSGVYFLLSHNDTKIQKIGKADGRGGLKGRLRGYTAKKTPHKINTDKTDRLWREKMTNHLLGESISVFYYETSPMEINKSYIQGNVEHSLVVEAQWARSLEEKLSRLAAQDVKERGVTYEEMLLSGQN